MKWKCLNESTLYQGFFGLKGFELQHELFQGGDSPILKRELLIRSDVSAVLPYDPIRDEVVLIEQFRIGAKDREEGPWLTEIIAGYHEEGESAESVVFREAKEEAGCELTEVRQMMRYYPTPGCSAERVYLYLGRASTKGIGGIHGLEQEGEDIRVNVVSTQEAFDWLEAGRIDNAMAVVALQWLQLHIDDVRTGWS